ncbi:choice-of-anchor A family protein [Pseudorhodoferax sp.]|uniref:choice-of-anchor A family protein n=1 Tax=Pseudorhodoferax sp. TaxID=1993553 RepID=UPI002DD66436|nr:choice-of-anchor A family protein [Pseudorhodoferax sp.]
MFKSSKFLLSTAALFGASVAMAAPVSLGEASQYNLVSFGDFASKGTSIGGSVAVAGDFAASSYGLNGKNLVVGGDLNFSSGSIAGNAYVGGTRTTSSMSIGGQWLSGDAPLGFASLAKELGGLSHDLAGIATTGSSQYQWGGLQLTGTNSAVEIFNLSASTLASTNWNNKSNLASGSTLIFNIGGTSVNLSGGLFDGMGSYNVLLNFYEAQTITFNGMGIEASILAPTATVLGGNGQINGNVVVGDWQSSIALLGSRSFQTTEVAGYVLPEPIQPARPVLVPPLDAGLDDPQSSEVPEPAQLALFAVGLALLGVTRRKQLRAQRG